MTEYREQLIDRMIRIYGYEDSVTIAFCELCESDDISDRVLALLVNAHEKNKKII